MSLRWPLGAVTVLVVASSLVWPSPPATPAQAPAASTTSASGLDQEWLVDAEGRQYRIERLDKGAPHTRIGDHRVRVAYGPAFDLAGEDADSLWLKVYRDAGAGSERPARETLGDKASIVSSYGFDLPTSRTLAFDPFDEGLPGDGQWRYGFALADMNGDGHLDLVHGPARRGPALPVVFLGDGAGRWRRWDATFPAQRYDYGHAVVADFNRDGHPDIALGMHLIGVTVLLGDGAGRFKNASQGLDRLGPQAFSSHALVAVDWDGDGHVDLVGLGEGPRVAMVRGASGATRSGMGLALYRNLGDATWQKSTGAPGLAGDNLVLARSRPQGRPWLVASSVTRGENDLVVRPGAPFAVEPLSGLRPGANVQAVALADFDGDGHEDVAVAFDAYEGGRWRSGIDLLLWRPDGAVERRTVFVRPEVGAVTALSAGDLDGDGRPDLVALSGHGEMLVLRNAGGTAFSREDVKLTERISGCRGYHVRVQDLDGDGRADVVAAFAGEPVGVGTSRIEGCPGEGSLRAWRSRVRS